MDKRELQGYQRLLNDLHSEIEAESLGSLLIAVRKQRRNRTVKRSLAIAATLCIGGLAITYKTEPPPKTPAHYTEIELAGNWTPATSKPLFTEIGTDVKIAIEQIETTSYGPPQTVNDQGLIDLFDGRPFLISHAADGVPKRFFLIESPIYQ